MTLRPWPISFLMFVSYSHHIQVYFHQVWAQSERDEIWLDLDQSRSVVSYSRLIQVYFHQVLARSEQDEIWPVLDLRWPWPISFLMFIPYSRHAQVFCLIPSLGPIGASLNLTWPLILGIPDLGILGPPNKHKLTLPRTKVHPPTKFRKRGTYHLRENRRTDRQTDRRFPAL